MAKKEFSLRAQHARKQFDLRLTRDLIVLYQPDGSWSNVKRTKNSRSGPGS